MNGQRTGGRTADTPNKRNLYFLDRLTKVDCDPLEALVEIARDPATDTALRARMWAAPAVPLSERNSVELTASDERLDAPWVDRAPNYRPRQNRGLRIEQAA